MQLFCQCVIKNKILKLFTGNSKFWENRELRINFHNSEKYLELFVNFGNIPGNLFN